MSVVLGKASMGRHFTPGGPSGPIPEPNVFGPIDVSTAGTQMSVTPTGTLVVVTVVPDSIVVGG